MFRDVDYNRSVLTIASTATHLGNVKHAQNHSNTTLSYEFSALSSPTAFEQIFLKYELILLNTFTYILGESLTQCCKEAFRLIEISKHKGGHPRLGSVDLISVHPLCEETSLEQCGVIATGEVKLF